jgi:ACS family hexuronate transporter-like MFS transporter
MSLIRNRLTAALRRPEWKWCVCGLLLLATMLNYMDRQTLSLTILDIYQLFGKNPERYGATEAGFSFAFAIGSVVFGLLADRFDVRWVYPVVLIGWSAMGFATGFASSWGELLVYRTLLGFMEAGHWPCALRTTQAILSREQRSLGNGLLQSGAAVGAILTPLVVLGLVHTPERWGLPFWIIGTLGIIWAVVWFFVIGTTDKLRPVSMSPTEGAPVGPQDRAMAAFFWDRRFWVLVVVVSSINITWHYFRAWLTSFLADMEYEKNTAILFNSAYYIAADIGSLTVGFGTLYLIRRGHGVHRSRVLSFAACALLTTFCAIAVAFLPKGPMLLLLLLIVGFASLGLFPNYYTFTQELTVRHQGTLTGVLGCINWLAVAAMQLGVGWLVETTQSHRVGILIAGLSPLAATVALVGFWRESAGENMPLKATALEVK